MKINEILTEAPLPDEWDKQVFTPKTSYAEKIKYAVERAQKIGKGSSRTAFEIEYEGRSTILKVAHNAKGMAQNEAEANILDDTYVQQIGIAIPMIDYDTEHAQPVWIHMEKAQRATEKQLSKLMQSGTLRWLVYAAIHAYSGAGQDGTDMVLAHYGLTSRDEIDTFFEYVDKLQELMSKGVNLGDFKLAQNWGIYNGAPVVIDLGFNDEISKQYYR